MSPEDVEHIGEPGDENVMRSLIPASAFAAMDADALRCQLYPGFVKSFQHIAAKVFVAYLSRPFRYGKVLGIFVCPRGFVMRDSMRIVAPAALRDVQIDQFRNYVAAAPVSIGDHEPLRVFFPDSVGRRFGYFAVDVAGHGGAGGMLVVHVNAHRGFIQQIEAEQVFGDAAISPGPEIPMIAKGFLRCFVGPQVVRLMKAGIDTIARRPVQVEAYVYTAFIDHRDKVIDLLYFFFVDLVDFVRGDIPAAVEMQIIRVGHGDADEIEAPVPHPADMVFGGRMGGRGGVGRKKVQDVEAFPSGKGIGFSAAGGQCSFVQERETGGQEAGVFDKVSATHTC